jgi:hypothetical protein
MAFDDIPWAASQTVNSGDKPADGLTSFSTKNAQHLATLLARIIAALDHIDAN